MPIEAALTMVGLVIFACVFLLSEGGGKAVAILVFIAGILVSTSGFAGAIKDIITQVIT